MQNDIKTREETRKKEIKEVRRGRVMYQKRMNFTPQGKSYTGING